MWICSTSLMFALIALLLKEDVGTEARGGFMRGNLR